MRPKTDKTKKPPSLHPRELLVYLLRALFYMVAATVSVVALAWGVMNSHKGLLFHIKFWTNWSVMAHVVACVLQGALCIVRFFNDVPGEAVTRAAELVYTTAVGLCGAVSLAFWPLHLHNPRSIIADPAAARLFPAPIQHAAHTLPVVSLLVDMVLFPSEHKPRWPLLTELEAPLGVTAVYAVQTLLIGLWLHNPTSAHPILRQQWPYGVLDRLPLSGWLLLVGAVAAAMCAVQLLSYAFRTSVNNLIKAKTA